MNALMNLKQGKGVVVEQYYVTIHKFFHAKEPNKPKQIKMTNRRFITILYHTIPYTTIINLHKKTRIILQSQSLQRRLKSALTETMTAYTIQVRKSTGLISRGRIVLATN